MRLRQRYRVERIEQYRASCWTTDGAREVDVRWGVTLVVVLPEAAPGAPVVARLPCVGQSIHLADLTEAEAARFAIGQEFDVHLAPAEPGRVG